MTFDYPGYKLNLIQIDRCKDGSSHLFSYIYKFYSPVTKYHYILRAEYHKEDVFGIKFYRKLDRGSDRKYSKIINAGDVGNILMTCANVVPLLLSDENFKSSSFCLAGARTIDKEYIESKENTQRFRIYGSLIKMKFGKVTFAHFEYPKNSSYLLLNRKGIVNKNLAMKEERIRKMLIETYNEL